MAILVDAAIWPWRGDRWAHLVSDQDVQELHDFATSIGKKRVSFQGDHYDVNVAQRERALAAGAEAVDSRVIVRSLRAAGLRRRQPDPADQWEWHVRTRVVGPRQALDALAPVTDLPGGDVLVSSAAELVADSSLAAAPTDVVALRSASMTAVLLTAPTTAWGVNPALERFDVHEAYTSEDDGALTVELLRRSHAR